MDRIDRMALQFCEVLAETERLTSRGIKDYQRNLLVPLLEHARSQTSLYRERLSPFFTANGFDFARWAEVPILTRADAQKNAARLRAEVLPAHAGPVTAEETSGSTGRPFEHLRNELAHVANIAFTDRAFRWWKMDGNKTMASFTSRRKHLAPPPHGSSITGWRVGCSGWHHTIDMWADTDVQIDWLLARRPHYLTAYSSTLLALAETVQRRNLDLRFEAVVSNATAISDEIRATCRDVFGVEPMDHYGAQEVGSIAAECPHCRQYHVNAEGVLVEILRDDGSECAPGETGRVIVTSLYNYAMPFIRYEVGDYAVTSARDVKCRIKLPSLARVLGRYRSTFTLKDGRIIYPYVAIGRFRDFISFEQVQVVQTDYDALEVRYVPLDGRPADADGLQAYLREAIDPSFHVKAVPVSEIPRAESGKFEDFLSLVPRHAS